MALNAQIIAARDPGLPGGSIIGIDVFKSHLVLHVADGRQIRIDHAASGQSIWWSAHYQSLRFSPIPFKDQNYRG